MISIAWLYPFSNLTFEGTCFLTCNLEKLNMKKNKNCSFYLLGKVFGFADIKVISSFLLATISMMTMFNFQFWWSQDKNR